MSSLPVTEDSMDGNDTTTEAATIVVPLTATQIIYHPSFEDPSTDVILQSGDGVRFRMHSIVLRNSSVFFRAMLSLPNASSSSSIDDHTILRLEELSPIMATAFAMISGLEFPPPSTPFSFDSLADVESLLQFAEKYGMPGPLSTVRLSITRPGIFLIEHADSFEAELAHRPSALDVYRIACRQGWNDVASVASRWCLQYDLLAPSPQLLEALRGVSLQDFSRLLQLVRRRITAFETALNDANNFHGSHPGYVCRMCAKPVEDPAWRLMRLALVRRLERCPRGDLIRDFDLVKTSPEWALTMMASHCDKRMYHAEGTKAEILRQLDALPDQLD